MSVLGPVGSNVLRTVGRSSTATRGARPSGHRGHVSPLLPPSGVELVGLGCTLAEWDAIAATMPPGLRPARVNWNGSFERAAINYRRGVASATPPPAPEPVPPPDGSRPRRTSIQVDVKRALFAGAQTITDLEAAMPRDSRTTIRAALYRLLALGEVVHLGPRRLGAHTRPETLTRYALAPEALRQFHRADAPGTREQGAA